MNHSIDGSVFQRKGAYLRQDLTGKKDGRPSIRVDLEGLEAGMSLEAATDLRFTVARKYQAWLRRRGFKSCALGMRMEDPS